MPFTGSLYAQKAWGRGVHFLLREKEKMPALSRFNTADGLASLLSKAKTFCITERGDKLNANAPVKVKDACVCLSAVLFLTQ